MLSIDRITGGFGTNSARAYLFKLQNCPGARVKAIQICLNGKKLFTSGLEDGIVTARLTLRNQVDPIWFDVDGRDQSTGGHERWAHASIEVGDEFAMKLVDVDPADVDHVQ